MKALDDNNWGGLDLLGGVKGSVDVVVDRLHDALSLLKRLDVLEHEVELLLGRVERSEARDLAALAIIKVVVIEADHSGHVRDKGVRLPSAVTKSATEGSALISAEGGGHATHEGGLSAAGVSSESDNNRRLSVLKGGKGRLSTKVRGREAGEGTRRSEEGGGDDLHGFGWDG